jgi:hypothetical protein
MIMSLILDKILIFSVKNMQTTGSSEQIPLEKLLNHIFAIGKISRYDQQLLMSTLLSKDGFNEEERLQISRVFDALQRGLLKVVD